MRQITICIPTWNRPQMTIESFVPVYKDERIKEFVIIDDASEEHNFIDLQSRCIPLLKTSLFRNPNNEDCYVNKAISVSYATTDYVCVFDSDNILNKEYIDAIFSQEWDEKTVYCPVYAKPQFDYREFTNLEITKENVGDYLDKPMFQTALNTFNCFINRKEYLRVWDGTVDPVTSDSIYFMYCWLKAGNKIKFVEGMEYLHTVHDGSHYQNNCSRTSEEFNGILIEKLRSLS